MERIEDRFGRTLATAINWGVAIGLFIGLLMAGIARSEPAIDFNRAVYVNGPILNSIVPLGTKIRAFSLETKIDAGKKVENVGWDKPIHIILNSPGGSVVAGNLFIASIKEVQSRGVAVYCYNQHIAASMAFQIMLHCDRRYALKSSLFLWHEARVSLDGQTGTEDFLRKIADDLKAVNETMYEDLKTLPMNNDTIRHHYHHETLHMAENLQNLAPGWMEVRDVIPGLLDIPEEVMRPEASMFDLFRRMGTFVYIAPRSLL